MPAYGYSPDDLKQWNESGVDPHTTDMPALAARITSHLGRGGEVTIATHLRATVYKSQHADWFSVGSDGNLYVRRGKGRDCLSIARILSVGLRFHGKPLGEPAFALANDAPKQRPAKFETAKGKQRDLFIGLNDLPGQIYLIPEANTD
jgi:hypothetical protein